MKTLGELLQTNDWKNEKHVPVIECPDSARVGEKFDIIVSVGKEIPHPNTTDHHIRWIQIFFKPEGDKFSYQIANCQFAAHGESIAGADQGCVYTDHSVAVKATINKSGTIYALSFCNIHGLWESSRDVEIT